MNSKTNQIQGTKPRSRRAGSHLTMAVAGGCALLLMGCAERNEPEVSSYPATPAADEYQSDAANDAAVAQQNAESPAATSANQSDAVSAAQSTDPELAQTQQSSAQTRTEPGMESQQSGSQVSAKQQWDSASESQELEQRIRDDLRTSTDIPLTDQQLSQIQIQVENQKVTLTGSVPSQATADQIEQQVEQIPGVSSVDNQIYASPQDMQSEPSSQSQPMQ